MFSPRRDDGVMPSKITHVQPGSIAQKLGLQAGDEMLTIAGEPVIDQIDYQALTASSHFDMEIITKDNERKTVTVRKHDWEPLGITLDQSIVSSPRP